MNVNQGSPRGRGAVHRGRGRRARGVSLPSPARGRVARRVWGPPGAGGGGAGAGQACGGAGGSARGEIRRGGGGPAWRMRTALF